MFLTFNSYEINGSTIQVKLYYDDDCEETSKGYTIEVEETEYPGKTPTIENLHWSFGFHGISNAYACEWADIVFDLFAEAERKQELGPEIDELYQIDCDYLVKEHREEHGIEYTSRDFMKDLPIILKKIDATRDPVPK